MSMPRTLYRSQTDTVLAGVCGGLGEYFNIDSTLIRVLFAVGGAFFLYIILWAILPLSPLGDANEKSVPNQGPFYAIKTDTKRKSK